MSLGKYLTINNTLMPNPRTGTWTEALNPIESEFFTENGTRKTIPTRLDRWSWSAQFDCTSTMKNSLIYLSKQARVTCTVRNTTYEGTLRITGAITLVENTEYTEGTDGLWTVPVSFQSF